MLNVVKTIFIKPPAIVETCAQAGNNTKLMWA